MSQAIRPTVTFFTTVRTLVKIGHVNWKYRNTGSRLLLNGAIWKLLQKVMTNLWNTTEKTFIEKHYKKVYKDVLYIFHREIFLSFPPAAMKCTGSPVEKQMSLISAECSVNTANSL